jgi:hypothetical protein
LFSFLGFFFLSTHLIIRFHKRIYSFSASQIEFSSITLNFHHFLLQRNPAVVIQSQSTILEKSFTILTDIHGSSSFKNHVLFSYILHPTNSVLFAP